MKRCWVLLLTACGGGGHKGPRMPEQPPPSPPVVIEWKVEQGQGSQVDVTLIVDGTKHALGALEAATEMEPGTPNTCALRAASALRTELVCGDANSYAAHLKDGELVVSLIAGESRSEVKRLPVQGIELSVRMLLLPGSKL